MTPAQYVQNVLLGSGVTVSNVTFQGNASQIGEFNSANANVGITAGLILSTGDVNVAVGPNNDGGATLPIGGFNGPGDADLDQIVGSFVGTNDAAVLEFDFIPESDTIQFEYVFASEEYLEFVNGGYNDAFGFFLSGPGISGPYSNGAVNLAVLPNGTPVTIDNVNNISNPTFYVDNGDGFSPPYSTDPSYIQFDGMTVKLTAKYPVQCGQTYHIKLAVADAGDAAYDSGVFIEEHSFTSANPKITSVPSVSGIGNDSTIVEGCGGLNISFERYNLLDSSISIYYYFTGQAQPGTDFEGLPPDSIHFPVGVSTLTYNVTATYDNIDEGLESVTLNLLVHNQCTNQSDTTTFTFYIDDPSNISVTATDDTLGCFQDSVFISTAVSGGYSPYTYLWDYGNTTSSGYVSPSQTTNYVITVTDICGIKQGTDTSTIYVPKDPIVTTPTFYNTTCPRDTLVVIPQISGGHPPYYLIWEDGNEGVNYADTVAPYSSTTIFVSVTDECKKDTVTSYVKIFIPEYPPLILHLNQDTVYTECPGETVAANPSAEGGAPPYYFSWDNWQTLDDSIVFTANSSKDLTVQLTDHCHTDTVSKNFHVYVPDYSGFSIVSDYDSIICIGDSTPIVIEPSGGAGSYQILWSDFLGTKDSVVVSTKSEKDFSVTVTDKCGNKTSEDFHIQISQPKADFDYDYYSDLNNVWFYSQSNGSSIREIWDFGDGSGATGDTVKHRFENIDNYYIKLTVKDQYGCKDSIIKEFVPPMSIYFPNTFTPDGDGFNEIFKAYGENVIEFTLRIFDRWGKQVYYSEDINEGWDGTYYNSGKKPLPSGAYVYQYTIKTYDAREDIKKGAGIVFLQR